MKTDIEIAKEAKMLPITDIACALGIEDEELELYGRYKAKINDAFLRRTADRKNGKLILVTAINPTPAGEGKTTTTVGLGMAMNKIGKNAIIALREPSLGPVFGIKGGAAGGGYAQVVPMEDINLHFTGDFHAITAANNLLSAMIDNHLQQGNELGIDPRRILFARVTDTNDRALRNVETCFASYAPDGGYSEGAGAWSKSARALSLMIAMLQKACGNDYGLASAPGFAATGYYAIATETASGMWNFHNSAAVPNETSILSWMSTQYADPTYAYVRHQQIANNQKAVTPLDILFYTPVDASYTPTLPTDTVYRKAGLAIMRSGWGKKDTFVGLHGGANDEVNGDLDAGSVVLEMAGERFFAETGGIESLPIMMRRRAVGQNTIVVNSAAEPAPDQEPHANAKIVEMKGCEDRIYAVVDMTSTSKDILRGKRGVMLTDNRKTVVVQDELVLTAPGEILWTVYTPAEVEILNGGKVAKLTIGDKVLKCQIGGFGKAKFAAEKVENCDLTRLYIKAEVKERLRLSVAARVIGEGDDFDAKLYEVTPISTWGDAE